MPTTTPVCSHCGDVILAVHATYNCFNCEFRIHSYCNRPNLSIRIGNIHIRRKPPTWPNTCLLYTSPSPRD